MLEYVFFDQRPRALFLTNIQNLNIDAQCDEKHGEFLVRISDQLDPQYVDVVEQHYEATFELSEALMAEEDADAYAVLAGVQVHTSQGSSMASVNAALLKKVMSVLDYDELGTLVDAIVYAVEHPDSSPICQRADVRKSAREA